MFKPPASDARKIQLILAGVLATTEMPSMSGDDTQKGLAVLQKALAAIDNDTYEQVLKIIAKYVHVDGSSLNEDAQFTADTLFELYEIIFLFLKETFSSFFAGALSRFSQGQTTALKP
jgi:hypothetical protein